MRAHTAAATIDWLRQRCSVLPGWPPNSQDLNAIEMVWAILEARVEKIAPETKQELSQIIGEVWDALYQRIVNRLLASFTSRLELVIKARGRSISPYLSSHQSEPTPEDVAANPDFRPFTGEEDELILHWVGRLGNHWKRICDSLEPHFGARERTEIKHRVKWLTDIHENHQPSRLTHHLSRTRSTELC
jgi:hypothetical protein